MLQSSLQYYVKAVAAAGGGAESDKSSDDEEDQEEACDETIAVPLSSKVSAAVADAGANASKAAGKGDPNPAALFKAKGDKPGASAPSGSLEAATQPSTTFTKNERLVAATPDFKSNLGAPAAGVPAAGGSPGPGASSEEVRTPASPACAIKKSFIVGTSVVPVSTPSPRAGQPSSGVVSACLTAGASGATSATVPAYAVVYSPARV